MAGNDKTTIQVDKEVKHFLDTQGLKVESYNQILRRLLTKLGAKFSDGDTIEKEAEDVSH